MKFKMKIEISNFVTIKFAAVLVFAFAQSSHAQSDSTRPLYEENFIAPPGLFPANHSSTLVELPDGRIFACWYAGAKEGAHDVQIYCSYQDFGSENWSAPTVAVKRKERARMAALKNKSLGNPVLYLDNENILWLFYSSVAVGGWSLAFVDYKTSRDFGLTWSKSRRLRWMPGNLTRAKPLQLDQDHMMLPLYKELYKKQGYTCILQLKRGKIVGKRCDNIPGQHHLQPALVQNGDRILAYLRTDKSHAVEFSQYINGKWSKTKSTNLPNPNSSVDVLSTSSGRILLVYNHSASERTPLSLAISDDGEHFEKIWDFENEIAPGNFSYPAFIQSSDGFYHLSYTYHIRAAIKHVTFNGKWLGF